MQTLARSLLLIQGLMCIVYGIVVAFNLDNLAAYMGLAIMSGDGRAEMLTMYLGMSGAMGLFQVYAGLSSKLLREALFFMLISMTGITLGRLCGLLAFETGEYIASSLLYDIPVVMLTAIAYKNLFWLTHAQKSPA